MMHGLQRYLGYNVQSTYLHNGMQSTEIFMLWHMVYKDIYAMTYGLERYLCNDF